MVSRKKGHPAPKSDKRWQKTHERLLDVGMSLLSLHGAEAVTVDMVTEAASISKQTFAHHFLDIEALIDEAWRNSIRMIEIRVDEANADEPDPAKRIVRGMAVYVRMAMIEPDRFRFLNRYWFKSLAIAQGNSGLEADISDGMISGRFRINDVESALFLLLGGAGALIQRVLISQSNSETAMIAQEVLLLMLTTLGLKRPEAQRISTQTTEEFLRQLPVSERVPRSNVLQNQETVATHSLT
ncbi:MAG: hypothetical protein CMK09_04910 [Ponticaulis sp.]|nr:hypothetical protein [Ponticaulis sp.]|tara:strand:- start:25157 stop:25879 length:723 start_codon:yes stop_codon:yes gene_type:complete